LILNMSNVNMTNRDETPPSLEYVKLVWPDADRNKRVTFFFRTSSGDDSVKATIERGGKSIKLQWKRSEKMLDPQKVIQEMSTFRADQMHGKKHAHFKIFCKKWRDKCNETTANRLVSHLQ
jgi:hypothetical protein